MIHSNIIKQTGIIASGHTMCPLHKQYLTDLWNNKSMEMIRTALLLTITHNWSNFKKCNPASSWYLVSFQRKKDFFTWSVSSFCRLWEQAASLLHRTSMSCVTLTAAGCFYTAELQRAHIASGCLSPWNQSPPSRGSLE